MSTAERTRAVLAAQFNTPEGAELADSMTMIADLGGDSLDVVELKLRLEDEFEIQLNHLDDLRTVGDVVKHMEGIIDGKG